METVRLWQGEDWEKWCLQLLQLAYGRDSVQPVPARHKGDLGIEAFTHDGHAFQCYAVQEPVPTKERYEKQRDKLTTDIGKLLIKKEDFIRMLGSIQLHCYFFMLPLWDSKELVQHATTKALEVKSWDLPFIDSSNFRIMIANDDSFADARGKLLARPPDLVSISPVNSDDTSAWISENSEPYETIDRKLTNIFTEEERRKRYIESLLGKHIESGNTLEKLRTRFPDQWEVAVATIRSQESFLDLEHLDGSKPPSTTLVKEIVNDLRNTLTRDVNLIGPGAINGIAWGTIADWLIRCPLDFEDAA
ncbi:hypothetical protein [Catenuloplanes atrovinosus]|uniref:Uncharacterized protein n=1 Tax=Catenuloplanes atrovinosus TaxID=137266 RepID=A0AAE3YTJ6_9ACTN|nr:hypothetical protein [Catenuloplanes atrovinosus]MDR7278380.1 hypothetical protein [Catenuloplanes atrovinosus]